RHTRLQGDWSSDVCSSDLISEAFSTVHPKAGSDAGFHTVEPNLWNPNGPTEDTRPALTCAPHARWLIGLGHLGQAYAWVISWLKIGRASCRERVWVAEGGG